MVRSPITEEASIPNEQASAQVASHELRARDRLRIITSYKEQDIILAGEGGAHMLTGFAPICPALEQVSTGPLNLSFFVAVITPCPRAFGSFGLPVVFDATGKNGSTWPQTAYPKIDMETRKARLEL
jgi:hypothetical protein